MTFLVISLPLSSYISMPPLVSLGHFQRQTLPLPLSSLSHAHTETPTAIAIVPQALSFMQVLSPPRPISPARAGSPLNARTQASMPSSISTKAHLANLERLLQKPAESPPRTALPSKPTKNQQPTTSTSNPNPLLNALTLPPFFPRPSAAADQMSPRTLTRLRHLLSEPPRPSPRNPIASRWRQFHGASDWAGMLDPLNEDLRRELIRYGDLVQSAYHAYFNSNPDISPSQPRPVPLPDLSYRVVRNLFATSSLNLPDWVPGAEHKSSWIGYVAVCDNEREISRLGRRDIVIALRGTATSHEWAENLRADLVSIEDETTAVETESSASTRTRTNPLSRYFDSRATRQRISNQNARAAKVERGFWSLFKTPGAHVPSLSASVVDEVRKLMEQYKGEELSITVTGHSLGAALAVLVADELGGGTCGPHVPPIAVISFGGPRVGSRGFADRVERRGVKVLRVVNAHDVITRVPGVMPREIEARVDGYAHVGRELRVDSRVSPYLRPNADPACCHDLEAYLHLVDGFMGSNRPFRSNAKRSLVRLLNQQGSNLKQKYVSKARELLVDPVRSNVNVPGCLASPSQLFN